MTFRNPTKSRLKRFPIRHCCCPSERPTRLASHETQKCGASQVIRRGSAGYRVFNIRNENYSIRGCSRKTGFYQFGFKKCSAPLQLFWEILIFDGAQMHLTSVRLMLAYFSAPALYSISSNLRLPRNCRRYWRKSIGCRHCVLQQTKRPRVILIPQPNRRTNCGIARGRNR